MELLLTGITGLRNRGVEALVTVIAQELGGPGGAALTALTPTVDYDRFVGPEGVDFVFDEVRVPVGRVKRARRELSRRVSAADRAHARVRARIAAADGLVATGGDVFSSDYGSLSRHLAPLRIARDVGTPYALLAQSIGPFKTQAERDEFADVARGAAHISVREEISERYLVEVLGIDAGSVLLTQDPAFRLAAPDERAVGALLARYGVDAERPYVVVCPSRGISHYADADPNAHAIAWRETIDLVRTELRAQVLLVPHVQDVSVGNDDRLYATSIVSGLEDPRDVLFAGANESASTFKGLVSRAELTVTERMHAAVASLSTARAVVPISYSIKTPGVLRNFAGAETADRVVLELKDFMNAERRRAHVLDVWDARAELAAQFAAARSIAADQAADCFVQLRRQLSR